MKTTAAWLCVTTLTVIFAFTSMADEVTTEKTTDAVQSITNGYTVIPIGTAGLRLAGKGGASGNILEAMKAKVQTTAFARSNVTVRVQLADNSNVTMAFNQAAGRYVASVTGEATCEVLDNTTGRTIKQVRVPANGDLQSAEFYDRLTAEMVRRLTE